MLPWPVDGGMPGPGGEDPSFEEGIELREPGGGKYMGEEPPGGPWE